VPTAGRKGHPRPPSETDLCGLDSPEVLIELERQERDRPGAGFAIYRRFLLDNKPLKLGETLRIERRIWTRSGKAIAADKPAKLALGERANSDRPELKLR
jgi:hypothetical protein